ncbi:porin [Sphingobacterium paucimobilis]|nr:porin [Sphingobacterium paucimobilis]
MKSIAVLMGTMFCCSLSMAQDNREMRIGGYAEIYYQHDFAAAKSNQRPNFIYSHNRNNEVSLNLGMVKVSYRSEGVRADLALGVGSYMSANYAAEPGVLKNIYEGHIGVRLSKAHELWLDLGVLPSHIGAESAEGVNCPTLTRSIMAENSPYFETGAKLSYQTRNEKWQMALLALNGWQRIQRIDGNTTPAFGHQLIYRPSDRLILNSSSFVGNDQPDSTRQMRYFHNLYGQYQWSEKINFTAGFDVGAQQESKGSNTYYQWYTGALIVQYKFHDKMAIAGRTEYYKDRHGVIISTEDSKGMESFGTSVNVDYQILPNLVWRTEVKDLVLRGRQHWSALTALAVRF